MHAHLPSLSFPLSPLVHVVVDGYVQGRIVVVTYDGRRAVRLAYLLGFLLAYAYSVSLILPPVDFGKARPRISGRVVIRVKTLLPLYLAIVKVPIVGF